MGFEDDRGSVAVELRVGSGIGDYGPTAAGLHWAPALGGAVMLDWRITPWLSVYGGASRNAFRCDQGECSGLDVDFVSQGWDLGARGDLDVKGRPWARLGLVRHRLETRWFEEGEDGNRTSPQGLGVEASAGIEVPLHRRMSLTPGVRYLRWLVSDEAGNRFVDPRSPQDPLRVVVLGAGLRVRF